MTTPRTTPQHRRAFMTIEADRSMYDECLQYVAFFKASCIGFALIDDQGGKCTMSFFIARNKQLGSS
jgi:hypothetical protein